MAAIVVMLVALGGCGPSGSAETAQAESSDVGDSTGARIVNVVVRPVDLSDFVDYVRVVGEVDAMHDVTLSAEEAGPIREFLVEKGARLAAGQTIAKIDDDVLAAQTREARELADIAREQYERQRRLWEDDHIGSEIAYLHSKSSSAAAAARLETLEARLTRTEIRTPVAGVFDQKFVEAGEMVSPGTPVARVVSTGTVKVTGGVPERYGIDVVPGDEVSVTFDVLPGRTFHGRTRYVGQSVDPQNRTIPVEVWLPNPAGVIRPRMVANMEIERRRFQDVVVVSQDVIERTEDGYQVFVAGDRDGVAVAEARPVSLGDSYANRVVIETGLSAGDALIVGGHRMVDNGTRIRIVSDSGAAQ